MLRRVDYFNYCVNVAKHLETLVSKDGVALEILKRTKDEEVNRKTFTDITDVIKSSGVSHRLRNANWRKKSGFSLKINSRESLSQSGKKCTIKSNQNSRNMMYHLVSLWQ